MQNFCAEFFEQFVSYFFGLGFVAFKVDIAAVAACLRFSQHVRTGDLMAVVAVVRERKFLPMHGP